MDTVRKRWGFARLGGMNVQPDGLYQVNWKGVCAGVVVRNGRVECCAPVLRRHLKWIFRYAHRVTGL